MKWIAEMLAHFPLTRQFVVNDRERERKHRDTIQKADRVIEEYRRLDAVLRLHVRHK